MRIVDFNAHTGSLSRHIPSLDPCDLVAIMETSGISRAVVSDLGEVFGHETACHTPEGPPADTVTFLPVRPGGQLQSENARGIRIYPTYHTWDFRSTEWADLLSAARREGWIVQVFLRLLDPRGFPQAVASARVIESLSPEMERNRDIRFVMSGMNLFEAEANTRLLRRDNVWLETAHLQHPMNSLPKLVDLLGSERILFGSNLPLFYPGAAVFRALNSGLTETNLRLFMHDNADNLLRTDA